MINVASGTPFVGYAQLTNGTPGPIPFSLFLTMGQTAVAMPANLRPYIVNITMSSNDVTPAIVTVDTGGTTPTTISRGYMAASVILQPEQIEPGFCRGVLGTMPRVAAPGVTGGATVECIIHGYLSAT